ncbi:MAG: cysteine desulfurase [Candidatus Omnitrophica bacterium]|nr:cysteine desulfurase [Candidatus Omnitrophota bacterium]
MVERIYLDYASQTPMLSEVRQAMAAALEEAGNPSSIHGEGRRAKQLLEQARKQVAALINAKPEEIYFTSCGTESNNWALRGLLAANQRKGIPGPPENRASRTSRTTQVGKHLVISAIEHPSISLVARRLELDRRATVSLLPVDSEGIIAPSALKALIKPETMLVSVMLANGEVGTIQSIKELAAIAHEHGALIHTDAIAAVGHISVDVKELGIDALSLAANQMYGPPGAAALYVRDGVRILPLLEGGGQEHGGRSGTEALPAIVGLGAAAERSDRYQISNSISDIALRRNRLRDGLKERIERIRFNGSWTSRLPHNLHVCIDGVSSESLVLGLDQAGIAAGLGSACNAKSMRPSHVLKAMGLSDDEAKGALVLSVGLPTTEEEIDRALEIIPRVVQQLRSVTALTTRYQI